MKLKNSLKKLSWHLRYRVWVLSLAFRKRPDLEDEFVFQHRMKKYVDFISKNPDNPELYGQYRFYGTIPYDWIDRIDDETLDINGFYRGKDGVVYKKEDDNG